jgi:hypothetical protein
VRPIDFAKAFGLGVLVMALNLGLLFALGFLYEQLIEPGRDQAYYITIFPKLGTWSAPIGAIGLLFLIAWLFGRRRPERSARVFGGVIYASYFAVDAVLGLATGPPSQLLVPPFLIALGGGLLAVYAGSALARRAGK